jgi:hypothetical protein
MSHTGTAGLPESQHATKTHKQGKGATVLAWRSSPMGAFDTVAGEAPSGPRRDADGRRV